MRIVVNDIAASSGGALTVLREFYNCIRENDAENEWIFLLGDKWIDETKNIKIITLPEVKNSRANKLKFDFFVGKKYIQDLKPDVVVSLQNIITFGLKVPQILYIHQSIPFQKNKRFSFLKREERSLAVYQYLIGAIIKLSARHSTKVIVQTEWMKKAICEQCHVPKNKVVKVTPSIHAVSSNPINVAFDPTCFFYPTSDAVYKNNRCVIEACKILDAAKIKYNLILTLPKEQAVENIRCVGRLDYDTVIQNYYKSTLIFPSSIESFGYPMAEARKVGAIVLASDYPFSREVLDGYENAYFFDPNKPQDLAELMKKIILNQITKHEIPITEENVIDSWIMVLTQILEAGTC